MEVIDAFLALVIKILAVFDNTLATNIILIFIAFLLGQIEENTAYTNGNLQDVRQKLFKLTKEVSKLRNEVNHDNKI